ncbi:MAG: peroxiredoxin [Pseudomonadota bacterium]
MIQINEKAPEFSGITDDGTEITLSQFAGKNVILYFYPKDDTPGCTQESKDFRDLHNEFTELNSVIIGISKDPVDSHVKFKEKYELPFILIADTETKIIQDYDVWKEKSMFGKKYMGIERTTILINSEGIIAKIWPKVKVKEQ